MWVILATHFPSYVKGEAIHERSPDTLAELAKVPSSMANLTPFWGLAFSTLMVIIILNTHVTP